MPITVNYNTFLKLKDHLAWRQIAQWIPSKGAVRHMAWKGYRMSDDGKVMDIPMFFVYVSVNDATGKVSASLYANIRFDPQGAGQQQIESFPIGNKSELNDELIKEHIGERYGVVEVDFVQHPVGGHISTLAHNIVMHESMINGENKTIANIYLLKLVYPNGNVGYRVETLTVDMATGIVNRNPQRIKSSYDNVKDGAQDFGRTIRHFQTVGYEVKKGTPEWANEGNWDFSMNLPKELSESIKSVINEEQQDDDVGDELEELMHRLEAEREMAPVDSVKTAQDVSQWYQGPLPNPSQLAPFVGGPSVEASQLRSAFGGVDESISMVNQFDGSLLSDVAFIFNFSSGSAYGVYLSALDEKIKREEVKNELKKLGYTIEEMPNGSFSAIHPKKPADEIKREMDGIYQRIQQKGGTTFGINMNKVMNAARQDALESKITDQEDLKDIIIMHLGATMVHEAIHSKGSSSEGPSEAGEQKFMEWVMPKINEKRKQRFMSQGKGETFGPLEIKPGSRRATHNEAWYKTFKSDPFFKKAQFGAQFLLAKPSQNQDLGPAPWSGILWDDGYAPIELQLEAGRTSSDFSKHLSLEKQMTEVRKLKWDNEVDTLQPMESLLEKDRSSLDGYRLTEKLMDEKRTKPLTLPVEASIEGLIKTAYSGEEGSCFGWMNNLDLPMSDRVKDGGISEDWAFMDFKKIRRLPRYNPEYDRKGFYNKIVEPRWQPELWDKMISERPSFMTSPARRFASTDIDTHKAIAVVLSVACSEIAEGNIKGTRFLCSKDICDHIEKFLRSDEAVKVHRFNGDSDLDFVWVVAQDVSDEIVEMAEGYASGKRDDRKSENLFDYVCGLSTHRKNVVEKIIDQVTEACHEHSIDGMFIVGDFPRVVVMDSPMSDVGTLEFISAVPDNAIRIGEIVAEKLGAEACDTDTSNPSFTFEWMGIVCRFIGDVSCKVTEAFLRQKGIPVNQISMATYARGLSIDMFLYGLDDPLKVYDPSGEGKSDIANKIVGSPMDQSLADLAKLHPSIALRAMRHAVRHSFSISKEVDNAIKQCSEAITGLPEEGLLDSINEILSQGKPAAEKMLEGYRLSNLSMFDQNVPVKTRQ